MTTKRDRANDGPDPNLDDFYEALLEAHEGLTFEQCVRMDTLLIMNLANRIGDIRVLKAALAAARKAAS